LNQNLWYILCHYDVLIMIIRIRFDVPKKKELESVDLMYG
jgi:hypothetical protein